MRTRIAGLAVLAMTTIAVGTAQASTAPRAPATCADAGLQLTVVSAPRVQKAIVCLANVERAARGLPALRVDAKLTKAAQAHTADMLRHRYFGHVDSRHETATGRVRRAGQKTGDAAENLGTGPTTASGTMDVWMANAAHRVLILSKSYRTTAVSVVVGGKLGTLYAQEFLTRTR